MKTSQGEINDLPIEPRSENQDKSCTQSSNSGDAQSDCAFDGAMIALVPITDAAHLIHGPSGCIGNSWGNRSSFSSGSTLYKIRFTTDTDENDIIFGGAKKLYKGILELVRRYKPAAVFVYSTCVSALIGDDVNGACKAATQVTGIPIIPVDSPGFVGSKNLGIRIAGEALLEYVIGTAEPEQITPYDINLIGEYNIAGALWNILPLLEKLGIRVLAKITGDARYKEICYAHRAKLNVVIASKSLLKMAKKMEERYGIPYIEASFYGIEDINRCLQNIAEKLGNNDLHQRTEKLIAQETAALDEKLTPYRIRLQGKRVVIYTGDVKSWLIISAAKMLGMSVIAISSKKNSREDQARIKSLLGKDSIFLPQDSPREILQVINDHQADILIASDRYQYTALQAKISFLDIRAEVHYPYTGYAGILEVAQELYATFFSPVWKQLHQKAPWEKTEVG